MKICPYCNEPTTNVVRYLNNAECLNCKVKFYGLELGISCIVIYGLHGKVNIFPEVPHIDFFVGDKIVYKITYLENITPFNINHWIDRMIKIKLFL